ncbi:MAG: hypothetical protein U9N03_00385 [Candidatus Caldatribacteriota bacterium]|nr:hypothetical protein [Candidatus Caldatribacteriota bacterium]
MKIKCPLCGYENYFSGLEDEETRFYSSCNEPLFKIRKEKSDKVFSGSKQMLDSQRFFERIQLGVENDFKQDYLFKIFKNSTIAVEVIRHLVEKKDINQKKYSLSDTEWSLILFEFIYFYLHLTDRFASGHMNEEQRGNLMIELEKLSIAATVDAVFLKWPKDKKEIIKKKCMGNFYIRVAEYSKYKKWLPKKGEGAKGTLLWEFVKTIAKLVGQEHRGDFILGIMQTLTNSLKDLDIKSFINRVRVI